MVDCSCLEGYFNTGELVCESKYLFITFKNVKINVRAVERILIIVFNVLKIIS